MHAAGDAAALGSAFTVAAFNLGTAVGTAVVGGLLDSTGVTSPVRIGAGIVALALVPTILLATARTGTARGGRPTAG
ncbi:hypothetical protein LQK89_07820 [Curtobacterium sp. C1]|uniref:hypothetical protein n=1 Tax=Curtobacterium sp. C1 TaxID=2898151 RepID=UPI001E298B45|nr:hypothetical protein [Curtobacterium sp. C1]UFU15584.1 hypothetical protein LQK89_07820 [Curtobacterium sp. C1]